MKIWDKEKVALIRARFPIGTPIKLNYMDDERAVPAGTKGKVWFVDDAGTIHVEWENGSSLGLVYGEDSFEVIEDGSDS